MPDRLTDESTPLASGPWLTDPTREPPTNNEFVVMAMGIFNWMKEANAQRAAKDAALTLAREMIAGHLAGFVGMGILNDWTAALAELETPTTTEET